MCESAGVVCHLEGSATGSGEGDAAIGGGSWARLLQRALPTAGPGGRRWPVGATLTMRQGLGMRIGRVGTLSVSCGRWTGAGCCRCCCGRVMVEAGRELKGVPPRAEDKALAGGPWTRRLITQVRCEGDIFVGPRR